MLFGKIPEAVVRQPGMVHLIDGIAGDQAALDEELEER